MADELDNSWRDMRGFEVLAVGIASVSYDEESKELINMRNRGAMLGDATVREGYLQGSIARGFEAAGDNPGGATGAFLGMGVGMGAGGGFMASASETNRQQMQNQQQMQNGAGDWTCRCGAYNSGKFCTSCGQPRPQPATGWTCSCGQNCTGNFCPNCGSQKPQQSTNWTCPDCNNVNPAGANFCSGCGRRK